MTQYTERDRRTDRQTHDDGIYRASIASRGKNQMFRLQQAFVEWSIGPSQAALRCHELRTSGFVDARNQSFSKIGWFTDG